MKGLMFDFVCTFTVFFIMSILFLRKVVKREMLLKTVEGVEDIVLKVIVGVILIYLMFARVIPMVQDIPHIIQSDYCMLEGVAQGNCSSSRLGMVGITMKEEKTQEEIYVEFAHQGKIVIGDKLVVQYLPHSKSGFLIELNGKSYHKAVE